LGFGVCNTLRSRHWLAYRLDLAHTSLSSFAKMNSKATQGTVIES
jgi:hypothetical protein